MPAITAYHLILGVIEAVVRYFAIAFLIRTIRRETRMSVDTAQRLFWRLIFRSS